MPHSAMSSFVQPSASSAISASVICVMPGLFLFRQLAAAPQAKGSDGSRRTPLNVNHSDDVFEWWAAEDSGSTTTHRR
jgi:hypothetical protein